LFDGLLKGKVIGVWHSFLVNATSASAVKLFGTCCKINY